MEGTKDRKEEDEEVDILDPITHSRTGITKYKSQAQKSGDWLGSFNLWIVKTARIPSIIYQQRSFQSAWAPGLLDVSVGGHYKAKETMKDGIREIREEIGKDYASESLFFLGNKVYVNDQLNGNKLRYVVDIFLKIDNSDLSTYIPQNSELEGLFVCPIEELLMIYKEENSSFLANGIKFNDRGNLVQAEIMVTKSSFPFNEDNYHERMVSIINRFLRGEKVTY